MFKNIIVPTDGSPISRAAAKSAVALAKSVLFPARAFGPWTIDASHEARRQDRDTYGMHGNAREARTSRS